MSFDVTKSWDAYNKRQEAEQLGEMADQIRYLVKKLVPMALSPDMIPIRYGDKYFYIESIECGEETAYVFMHGSMKVDDGTSRMYIEVKVKIRVQIVFAGDDIDYVATARQVVEEATKEANRWK